MGREDHSPEVPDDGPNIGPTLVEARMEKALSLAEVEQATKIRKRYLEGLERDDYTVLPDAVYTQGFLKTYANYLGLDGEEISGRLKTRRAPRRERQANKPPPAPVRNNTERPLLLSPGGLAGAEKSRVSGATILTVIISVFVLSAVIGVLYYVGRGSLPSVASDTNQPQQSSSNSADEPEKQPSANEEQSEKAQQPEKAGSQTAGKSGDGDNVEQASPAKKEPVEAPPDNLQVEVRVEDSASWISVLTDGEVVFNELGEPGFSQVFEADADVSLSVGNAGSVSVEVNGQDAGVLGEPGEVLTRNFTKKTAG